LKNEDELYNLIVIDRQTLRSVSLAKLKAAKILFNSRDFDTAGYLLGYVVECALKASVCKRLNLNQYPDTGRHKDVFASHDFDRLLILSGHAKEIDLSVNPDLFQNWSILTKDWKPETRYNENVYNDHVVKDKIIALEDRSNGFLSWIKRKW